LEPAGDSLEDGTKICKITTTMAATPVDAPMFFSIGMKTISFRSASCRTDAGDRLAAELRLNRNYG
jgi:hypothetical protein